MLIFSIIICSNGTGIAFAQWTEKDSIWLENVLSGREELKLNNETQKAIKEGSFLHDKYPLNKPLVAPPILPITKDFTDIITPDSALNAIDFDHLSPEVVILKRLKEMDSLKVNTDAFKLPQTVIPKDKIRIGDSPVSIAVGAQNLFSPEVKDGQRRGSIGGSATFTYSLNDFLLFIFSRKERQKRKNRKKAEQLKFYNNYP